MLGDTLRLLVVLLAAGSAGVSISIVAVFVARWRTCKASTRTADLLLLLHVVTMAAYVLGSATFSALVTLEHAGEPLSWRAWAAFGLNALQFYGLSAVYRMELLLHRRRL